MHATRPVTAATGPPLPPCEPLPPVPSVTPRETPEMPPPASVTPSGDGRCRKSIPPAYREGRRDPAPTQHGTARSALLGLSEPLNHAPPAWAPRSEWPREESNLRTQIRSSRQSQISRDPPRTFGSSGGFGWASASSISAYLGGSGGPHCGPTAIASRRAAPRSPAASGHPQADHMWRRPVKLRQLTPGEAIPGEHRQVPRCPAFLRRQSTPVRPRSAGSRRNGAALSTSAASPRRTKPNALTLPRDG